MLTQHILQNRSYVIALEGVACSEAATRASHWVMSVCTKAEALVLLKGL